MSLLITSLKQKSMTARKKRNSLFGFLKNSAKMVYSGTGWLVEMP
jgi:hypothetical protein